MELDWKELLGKVNQRRSQSVFEMRNTLLSQDRHHIEKKISFLPCYMWIDYCIVMLPHGRFTVYSCLVQFRFSDNTKDFHIYYFFIL